MRLIDIILRAILVSAVVLLSGCGGDQDSLEVSWQDEAMKVEVWAKPSKGATGRVATVLRVYDKRTKTENTVVLDDDVAPAHFRLVEFEEWILAVNGTYVLGGIHRPDRVLVGEHAWEKLPFTLWDGQGRVLAAGVKHGSGDGTAPAGFPTSRRS